jgi:ABC-type antimicrobial peptide transport system permease subunit
LLWPGQDPIGKRLMVGNDGYWRTVVGIAADPARPQGESPYRSPSNMVLVPHPQRYRPELLVLLQSTAAAGQLEAVRTAIRAIDADVAVADAATVEESILAWRRPVRAGLALIFSLGSLALAISALGIYGVVSYLVSRRTREFGIRMALGATRIRIVRMVLDDAVHLLLVGLLAGVWAAAMGERLLQAQRVRVMPNDVPTWVVVLLLILVVGLLAAYVPARRASRIDPNVALRDL